VAIKKIETYVLKQTNKQTNKTNKTNKQNKQNPKNHTP
jgi:hypothetical protein